MYPISFRANQNTILTNKSIQNKANKASDEVVEILRTKFKSYVDNIRKEVGPGIRLNELSKDFDCFCQELGLRASDYYKIFIECVRK